MAQEDGNVSDALSPAVAVLVVETRTTEFVWKKAHYNQRSATNTPVQKAHSQWFAVCVTMCGATNTIT